MTDVRPGLAIALLSAASFGLAGSLGAPLLAAGWTPGAVVLLRIGAAAVVLVAPALLVLRRWRPDARAAVYVGGYGLTAVAGAQLCFFSAVQYLPVGVALLLEYQAPVLLIGWRWFRIRQRPRAAVLAGAALALLGMAGVLDLVGPVALDARGVAFGLAAALCLACYFILSEQQDRQVPALALAAGGTVVGAVALAVAGLAGLLPLRATLGTVVLAGTNLPWWAPALLLVLVACVLAYLTGIVSVRRLGGERASFVALTEVLFATVAAVILLGQDLRPIQLVGGVLVLAGIMVVQRYAAAPTGRPRRARSIPSVF